MGKALALILQSVSLKLFKMPQIDYVVRRIPEKLTGNDNFSNFADLLL